MTKIIKYNQSSFLTNSKYSIKNYQSLALMAIVKELSPFLTKETPKELSESLLEEKVLTINTNDFPFKISKHDFIEAVKDLNQKDRWFKFEVIDNSNPKQTIERHRPLISGVDNIKGTSQIRIYIDKYTYGFIISSQSGFAQLEFQIRASLPNDEHRRFYDKIREFEPTGIWRTNFINFKKSCGIDTNKYLETKELNKKKIKPFINKLTEIYPATTINYKFYRSSEAISKGSRKKDMIEFRIDSPRKKVQGASKEEKGEVYSLIYNILSIAFGTSNDKAQKETDKIFDSEDCDKFYRRFKKFKHNEESFENSDHMINKIKYILKNDYGIE